MTAVPEPECAHTRAYIDQGVYVCLDCPLRAPVIDPRQHREYEAAIADEVRRLKVRAEAKLRLQEEAAPPPVLRSVTATEAIRLAGEHTDWLVESILPVGSSVLMTAQHKVGKTTFLQHLGVCLVKGQRFLDWAIPQPYPRPFLYINLDESGRGFGRELEKIRKDEGADPIPDGFRVLTLPPNDLDVAVPASVDALTEHVKEIGAGIVVLDVWGGAYSGDENDNSEVRRAVNNLLTMSVRAELDSLIIVHHAGWGEQVRARGASSIEGAVDVLWRYHRKDGEDFSRFKSGGRIPATSEVQVRFDSVTRRIWTVAPGSVGGAEYERLADRVRSGAATGAETELVVMAAVREYPGLTAPALQVHVGGKSQPVRDALKSLALKNQVRVERETGTTAAYYFPYDPDSPAEEPF